MLMNNASKVLLNIAAFIDTEIMNPVLQDAYIMTMVTDDTGMLRGDEKIVVKGVTVAAAKETDRMRQLEMLQMTANPIDMEIIGPDGRASLLRSVMDGVGLPYEKIVPTSQELATRQQAMAQQQQAAAQAQGDQAQSPRGQARMAEEFDNMHRTNA
jgi:hypothetical protein